MPQESLSVQKTACLNWTGNKHDPSEVWFVLHGYGQLSSYFLKKFEAFEHPDRLIIAPEGLHRFYRQGLSGKVGASWMTKEKREQDIADYVNWLNEAAKLFDKPIKYTQKLLLLGFSQGAASAARWATQSTLAFSDVVLWAAGFPPDISFPEPVSSKWHLCLGHEDKLHQSGFALDLKAVSGSEINVFNYRGGHDIPPEALRQWLALNGYTV